MHLIRFSKLAYSLFLRFSRLTFSLFLRFGGLIFFLIFGLAYLIFLGPNTVTDLLGFDAESLLEYKEHIDDHGVASLQWLFLGLALAGGLAFPPHLLQNFDAFVGPGHSFPLFGLNPRPYQGAGVENSCKVLF